MKLYVNSLTGNDSASGDQSAPFKTLTHALQQAQPNTSVSIAPGVYDTAHGEVFPLVIPSEVILIGKGNEIDPEEDVSIMGGGIYKSQDGKTENVTIVMGNFSELQGVTVTNDQTGGVGVWIKSVFSTVIFSQFAKSKQNGILVTGTAIVKVFDNIFTENDKYGIVLEGNTKGEIQSNQFIKNGGGIHIKNEAAPLVMNNKIQQNSTGILLGGNCQPVLRNNKIEENHSEGMTVIAQAQPDLGQSQDPGLNMIINNRTYDLQNASQFQLLSIGNQINPAKVQGNIRLGMSEVSLNLPNLISENIFNDIIGHWAEEFIIRLTQLKIISGFPDHTFRPNESLTRAQYAALLANSFDLLPVQKATDFTDIPDGFWAKNVILTANQAGFLVGFPDNSFRPHQNLTRIQAILSLVKGLKLSGGVSEILTIYRDRDSIPSYAVDAVATATVKEMIVNYPQPSFLSPQRDITRAEVAAILYQTLVLQNRTIAIYSPYIVRVSDRSKVLYS